MHGLHAVEELPRHARARIGQVPLLSVPAMLTRDYGKTRGHRLLLRAAREAGYNYRSIDKPSAGLLAGYAGYPRTDVFGELRNVRATLRLCKEDR